MPLRLPAIRPGHGVGLGLHRGNAETALGTAQQGVQPPHLGRQAVLIRTASDRRGDCSAGGTVGDQFWADWGRGGINVHRRTTRILCLRAAIPLHSIDERRNSPAHRDVGGREGPVDVIMHSCECGGSRSDRDLGYQSAQSAMAFCPVWPVSPRHPAVGPHAADGTSRMIEGETAIRGGSRRCGRLPMRQCLSNDVQLGCPVRG
jgi:hypothetical protein